VIKNNISPSCPIHAPPSELMVLDKAMHALSEARTLGEIKQIRDKAEAVRKYARSAALGLSAQNYAAEVKLRAERKAGSLLASLQLRGGDRKSNNRRDCLKLEDLGISQNQSTRWQLEATLPDDQFEKYLQATHAEGREIVATEVIRLASRSAGKEKRKQRSRRSVGRTATTVDRNGHATRSLPREPMLVKLDEALNEVKNHRDLIDNILQPLYTGRVKNIHPAEQRVLGRLLAEIKVHIDQLDRITHLVDFNGMPMRFEQALA